VKKTAFSLARLLLSRAVGVAGVVAILGACVEGLAALDRLRKESEGWKPQSDPSPDEPVDEFEARSMAAVVDIALTQASKLHGEARTQMIALVAEGMAKLRLPVAQRVVEILVETTGQSGMGSVMISMLLHRMWLSDASGRFFASVRNHIATLKGKLPKSQEDFGKIFDGFFETVEDLSDTAVDAFGNMVGGVYDVGKGVTDSVTTYFREVRERWSPKAKERSEIEEEQAVGAEV